jgi:hypothetical protein
MRSGSEVYLQETALLLEAVNVLALAGTSKFMSTTGVPIAALGELLRPEGSA